MKAAVLDSLNDPLSISQVDLPSTFGIPYVDHGQVLVRVICAGICGAQLQEISGQKGNPSHLPHLLGHEGSGIVEKVGEGVRNVKEGDKVVIHWRKGEGCDVSGATITRKSFMNPSGPMSGLYIDSPVKSGPITCFSEYSIVSENRVTRIEDDVPNDLACLLGCCLSTALGVIENEAKVKFGESVMIVGCGGVGLSLILAARLAHAYPIIAVDQSVSKLSIVKDLGADYFSENLDVNYADVIIDTTGHWPAIRDASIWLKDSGRMIMVGQPSPGWPLMFPEPSHLFNGDGKTIKATQGGCFSPSKDIPRYVNLWRSGALDDYSKLITHRISLDEINDGIDLMLQGKAGRVLIEMDRKSYKSPFSNEIMKGAVESILGLEGPIFDGIGV